MIKLPSPLLESLLNQVDFNKDAFVLAHEKPVSLTSIRVNNYKATIQDVFDSLGIETNAIEPVEWCEKAYYLPHRPSFIADPLFHAGAYYVQEASSMFLWEILSQCVSEYANMRVLDACAAPGGKSTLLSSYFKDGLIISNETIKSRVGVLQENISKWGKGNVVVTNNDSSDFKKIPDYFDVAVIDAPCSGSGLFRKNTLAINEWSEQNVEMCSKRQQRILQDLYGSVKKDGLIIYSTCSFSTAENEQIVDWFLNEYKVQSIKLDIKNWNIVETQSGENKGFGYRFYPDKVKGEGFFIAAFKKLDGGETSISQSKNLPPVSPYAAHLSEGFIQPSDDQFLFLQHENILAINKKFVPDVAWLQKFLYLKQAGITAGVIKGKDFIPDHELALSLIIHTGVPVINLTRLQAVHYLSKKEIQLQNAESGWCIAAYNGYKLGWMKVLKNRINNYLPLNRRILKEIN